MAALSYASRIARKGASGIQQMIASVVKANAADTVDFGADFAKVTAASIIGDTKSVPGITAIAGGAIAGTVITLPAGYVNDDIDLVVVGPALTT
ncbi:MAG TPA: hypothetical protein VGS01_09690 [Candidatus Limnocylindria bacterium]|nr:hypothetical protein [Candidatus Limnocylindria bacterium]